MAQDSYTLELECAAVFTSDTHSDRREFYNIRRRATKRIRALSNYLERYLLLTVMPAEQDVLLVTPLKKLSNMSKLYANSKDVLLNIYVTFFPKILRTSRNI